MKATDIKEQTVEELGNKLADVKKNLFNLKFQKAIGQLENTMAIHNLKKDVARIETVIREKELGINTKTVDKESGKARKKEKPAGKAAAKPRPAKKKEEASKKKE